MNKNKFSLLRDIADINPESIQRQYEFNKILYLDIANVEKGSIINLQEMSFNERPSRAQRVIRSNDILISTVRPNLKHYAFIQKAPLNLIASTGFAVIRARKINPRFLYYFLIRQEYIDYLTAIADTHTSTYPSFSPDVLANTKIPIIPQNIQNKIAAILSAFDDKIELNNRMNKTLENIAQAIFKHWFIDFEFPKDLQNLPSSIIGTDGKDEVSNLESLLKSPGYKSSGGKMVKSELGLIPEGWEVVKLKDIVIRNRKRIKYKNLWEKLNIIDLSVMPEFSMVINCFNEGHKFKTNIFELNEYDLLFGSIRPYFGKAGFSPIKGAVTGTVHCFKEKEKFYFSYVLLTITNKKFIDYAIQFSKGTKMPMIDWKNLANFLVALPKNKFILICFENIMRSLIKKIKENINQNQTLSQLRDSLLPRLMEGKIKV